MTAQADEWGTTLSATEGVTENRHRLGCLEFSPQPASGSALRAGSKRQ
jgi:hypothetical protein